MLDPTKPAIDTISRYTDMPDMSDWDEIDFMEESQLLNEEIGSIRRQIDDATAKFGPNLATWTPEDRTWLFKARAARMHIKRRLIAVRAERRRRYPDPDFKASQEAEVAARIDRKARGLAQERIDTLVAKSKASWKRLLSDLEVPDEASAMEAALMKAYAILEKLAGQGLVPDEDWTDFMHLAACARTAWRDHLIDQLAEIASEN